MNRLAIAAALVLFGLSTSSAARAEIVARPSAHGAVHIADDDVAGGGLGIASLGYNLEHEPILLVPQVAASFGGFGGGFEGFGARAVGGLRAGYTLAGAIEPALILRGGYGHATLTSADRAIHGGSVQLGVGADYRLDRDLTVGGELFYDGLFFPEALGPAGAPLAPEGAIHTLSLGVTVGFWL